MSVFLQIASRVEAAVEAYRSVRDIADREQWVEEFKKEFVSPHLHGIFNHSTFQIDKCLS
jgi:hypothetical protein